MPRAPERSCGSGPPTPRGRSACTSTYDLKETGNRLGVEIVGTNDKARPKNHMFGLDFILLKPE
jgi:hypothetical protein